MEQQSVMSPEVPQAEPSIDPVKLQFALNQLRSSQNLGSGALAGAVAAAIGAVAWAGITVATHYQIGFMAVGIGVLVGYALRTFGRGVDTAFGVAGAALAFLGCAAGNLLTGCVVIALSQEVPVSAVLTSLDGSLASEIMVAMFSPVDLLFYGLATYEGYKLSFRTVTAAELETLALA
jgi:hypothetical protein